jgi:hypothetical protein
MMRDSRFFGVARLRAEHGKFAIHLEGIGADNFAVVFFRQGERDVRLSHGRRASDQDGLAEDGAVGHGEREK